MSTRAEILCCRLEDTLEPSLGLLLLQPSMEGDKKLGKASIDAQALGPAASTLAQQPIGMDYVIRGDVLPTAP